MVNKNTSSFVYGLLFLAFALYFLIIVTEDLKWFSLLFIFLAIRDFRNWWKGR